MSYASTTSAVPTLHQQARFHEKIVASAAAGLLPMFVRCLCQLNLFQQASICWSLTETMQYYDTAWPPCRLSLPLVKKRKVKCGPVLYFTIKEAERHSIPGACLQCQTAAVLSAHVHAASCECCSAADIQAYASCGKCRLCGRETQTVRNDLQKNADRSFPVHHHLAVQAAWGCCIFVEFNLQLRRSLNFMSLHADGAAHIALPVCHHRRNGRPGAAVCGLDGAGRRAPRHAAGPFRPRSKPRGDGPPAV